MTRDEWQRGLRALYPINPVIPPDMAALLRQMDKRQEERL